MPLFVGSAAMAGEPTDRFAGYLDELIVLALGEDVVVASYSAGSNILRKATEALSWTPNDLKSVHLTSTGIGITLS